MGQKLSPPLLNGTIPAFYSSDEGIVFTIPFSMNRAVSQNQVKGFRIKIKTIQSGNELYTTDINTFSASGIIEFTIGNALDIAKFRIGQYYKIQIAYIDKENTVGFFSSVGVAKYTSTLRC